MKKRTRLICRGVLLVLLLLMCVPAMAATTWQQTGPVGGVISVLVVDPTDVQTIYAGSGLGVFKSADGGSSWSILNLNTGPTGINVMTLVIDPTSSQTLYAGTINNGVFKSTDSGTSWSAVNNGLPLSTTFSALAIDQTNSQIIYSGTSGGDVFKSTNGGGSWIKISWQENGWAAMSVNSLVISGQTIYAGTDNGVFKSTNTGGSWSAVNNGLPLSATVTVSALAVDPYATIYAGTSGGGVFMSSDGGNSWSAVYTLSSAFLGYYADMVGHNVNSLAINSKGNIYAATDNGVFMTLDGGGGSWSASNSGLTSTAVYALAIDPNNSQTIYAATSGGVFKGLYPAISGTPANSVTAGSAYGFIPTAAFGNSFSISNKPSWASFDSTTGTLTGTPTTAGTDSNILISVNNSTGTASLPAFSIAVAAQPLPTISGTPANSVTVGSHYTFTPSATNAISFSISNKPSWASFNTSTGALTGTPINDNVGSYSNIVISATNNSGTVGLPAFSIAVPLPMPTISGSPTTSALTDRLYLFTPSSSNATSFSITNKPSWASFDTTTGTLSGTPTISDVGATSGIIINATNSTGTTYLLGFSITVTSGWWSAVNNGLTNMTVHSFAIDPTSSQTCYAGTSGGVYKSIDGGGSWVAVNNGLTNTNVQSLIIDPTNSQAIYAGTGGGVFKSINGGASWSAVNSGLTAYELSVSSLAIDVTNSQIIYAGTDYGGVFKSTDGGNSWSAVNSGLTNQFVTTLSLDPTNSQTLYAGTNGGVFKSTDGGGAWAAVNSGITNLNIYSIAIDPSSSQTIYAGTYGGWVFKSTNGGNNWSAMVNGIHGTVIYSLAIDPTNSQTIYAGTDSGGFYKSSNGGSSWSTMVSGLLAGAILAIDIDPTNNKTLYVGTNSGVFKMGSPTIFGTPPTSATTGNSYLFTPTATGATSFRISNQPSWASFNPATGALTGIPTNADIGTTSNIVISATNSIGTAYLPTFSIVVMLPLPMPTISGTPPSSVTTGTSYSFTPTPTNATSFSITNKPSWANFDTVTGTLTGTPTAANVSTFSNIVISATNSTGTASLPAFSITVALPMPTISGIPASTVTTGNAYSFTPTATNATSFNITGSVPSGINFNNTTGTLSGTPTTIGTFSNIVIRATNSTGTVSLPAFSITVALPMPTISGTPATTITTGTAYSFTPTATNATSLSITNKPSWANFDTVTGTLTGTPTAANVSTFSNIVISATNSTGTASLLAFTITVALPMPTISGTPASTVTTGNAYSFTPTATNASSFSITGSIPSGLNFNDATGTLSGTPTIVGTYSNIVISATNSTGKVSLPAFAITVAQPMPTISGTPSSNVTSGNAYSFTPTATNATSFSINNKPTWATFDPTTGSLTGTPTNANAGVYSNIVISATNSTGTATILAFSITVALPMPTISGTPASSVTSGNAYSFTPTATNAASFSISNMPTWANFNTSTGALTGTPTTTGTSSNIVISATNSTGTAPLPAFSITVALPMPTVSGTPATTVTAGTPYSFTPTTTNASSFSITSTPSWASFDTTTGKLTGTPTVSNVGTYSNIVISATNSTGTVSLPAFSITVALPMPTIGGTSSTTGTAGTPYSFTPTATNAISFSITNKPVWATFDTSTGSLTGTPAIANVGTTSNIVISATNSTGTVSLAAFSITVALAPDITAPAVTAFTLPASFAKLVVPVTKLTATDNVGVTGYLLTETSTTPSANASGWSATAPSSYTFSTAGSKTLYAWAKDAAGNVSASVSATVTVDTTGPTLTLSTLSDGAITNNSTLNISGTVSDPDGVAALTINSASVSIAGDGSFSSAITLVAGSNTITTVAVDTLGNQTKDVRTITLDKTAPVLTVTSPADNSVTAQQVVTVSGTINETSTVSVTVNSGSPQLASITGTGFTQGVTLAAGLNTITIVATDLATNSTTVKRTVTYDNIKPSLTVTAPSQDITTSQSTLTLTGTVADSLSSVTVTISVDGKTFTPAVTQGAFSQQLTFLTEGTRAVTVTATDQVNNAVSVTRNIIYTLPKPHVTINTTTSPTTSTGQTIGGTMDAGSVVAVTCTTASIGQISYPTSTTWQVTLTGMATSTNSVTAIATASDGQTSDPATATITVQSSPPTGDLNGSGQVELADVLTAYKAVLGHDQLTAAQQKNADVAPLGPDGKPKGDGVVDIADIVLLLRHMVGLANW